MAVTLTPTQQETTLAPDQKSVTITPTQPVITLGATGGGGDIDSAANVGSGEQVFRDKTVATLNFRTLTASDGLAASTVGDEIDFSIDGFSGVTDTHLLAKSGTAVAGVDPATFAPASRTLTAGIGLSGGGDLSADRTFDVVGFRETSGPTDLLWSDIPDGELLIRNGGVVEGIPVSSVGVTDHGALGGLLDDDHSQYPLLAGRTGGQTLNGGTAAGNELILRGSTDADLGLVKSQSPIRIDTSIAASSELHALTYNATESYTAGFVGGGVDMSPTITFTNGLFIWEALRGSPNIQSQVDPAFAAFTLFQGLPVLRAGSVSNHNPLNPIVLNAGAVAQNEFAGTRTVDSHIVVNAAPQLKATVSGANMNSGQTTGLQWRPVWSTVAGSTINFGDVRSVWCQNPTNALFQPSSGVESMSSYIGLDFDNITFGGNVTKAAVRSAQASASNAYFLLQTGGAKSEFRGQVFFPADLTGITMGASNDFQYGWAGADFFYQQFNATADQMRWSNPSANRFQLGFDSGITQAEFNLACHKFSLGAQTGAVGNQIGAFVAGARTKSLNGGWADFLLTQAANLTVDADGDVAGWSINAPTMNVGTGTVTTATGLLVGGNVNLGTNRYGVHVLSSPSGGTLNYCARFEGAAGVRVDGVFEHTGSTLGFYGATPVTQSAAYTISNDTDRRTLDPTVDTLTQVANSLATLQRDLIALGILQ